MRIINKIILIIGIIFSTNILFATTDNYKSFIFGFDSSSIISDDLKDAKVALQLWIEELAIKEGGVQLEVKYFYDSEEIIDSYINGKINIQLASVDLLSYLKHKEEINKNSLMLWTVSNTENIFYQYYLIANKSSYIKDIKDIKDKSLIVKKNDLLAKIWLDKISYSYNHKAYSNLIKKQINDKKHSRLILKVFFNKADFAVVPKYAWDIMKEINPMIVSKIDIIKKSQKIFLPMVGMGKLGGNKEYMNIFLSVSQRAAKSKRSEQIRTLIKFDKVMILKEDFIHDFENFYLEYKHLKKLYP